MVSDEGGDGSAEAGDPEATLAPGPLLRIGSGELQLVIAPQAGGRIAQAGAPAEVLAHEAVSETYAVGVHLEQSARGTLLVEPYIQVH